MVGVGYGGTKGCEEGLEPALGEPLVLHHSITLNGVQEWRGMTPTQATHSSLVDLCLCKTLCFVLHRGSPSDPLENLCLFLFCLPPKAPVFPGFTPSIQPLVMRDPLLFHLPGFILV